MFLFWYFDLFYFFAQFLAKKSGLKILFFNIFLQFLMHFLVPSGTKFIANMDSEGEKKSNATSVGPRKCQQETISQYCLKLIKIYKIVTFISHFSTSNIVRLS